MPEMFTTVDARDCWYCGDPHPRIFDPGQGVMYCDPECQRDQYRAEARGRRGKGDTT
jgi:hypothetical protein